MIQTKHGKNMMIAPDLVIAVATLIEDKRDGQLYKDPLLVKTSKAYADSNMAELANYTLTTPLTTPLTTQIVYRFRAILAKWQVS